MRWDDADLPEGWKLSRVGDIAKIIGGGTPPTGVASNFSGTDGHPWITPADLTGYDNKFIGRGRRFLTDEGIASSSAKYIPAGSVLFSTRAPIGYVAIAECPLTTNQGFRSFVPSHEVDSSYLYYALKYLKPEAELMASGTTFPELSGSKAAQLPFAYPPIEQQRRIASTLDYCTIRNKNAAAHLETARHAIQRFRQSVLAAACSGRLTVDWRDLNPVIPSVERALANRIAGQRRSRANKEQAVDLPLPELPENYIVTSLGEAAILIEYGTSGRLNGTDDGIPVLRMGNIQGGQLELHDLKYRKLDRELEDLLLQDGDLLFNRTNSPELVGKSAVFHESGQMSFASYLIRVRFPRDVALPDFVNYWINSAWGRLWARQARTDGVSQSNINGSKLALMPLPLPPIDEQRLIVERASSMLEAANRLLSSLDKASYRMEQSKQAAFSKAFRGDLPIPITDCDNGSEVDEGSQA